MNKKNKGFTTIELITSFTLASVIMLILFNIILILKDNLSEVNAKTNMLVEKDNLSYNINKRFKEKEISSITMCEEGDKCYEFTYSDDTSDKLIYSNTDKTITFNNYTFDIIDGITVEEPTITEHYDTMSSTTYNGYFIINIPIKIDNKDYSIKINKHFNTDSVAVDLPEEIRDNDGNRYIVVEYLESTGSQYIDTGYIPNSDNTKMEIKYKLLNLNGYESAGLFGAGLGADKASFDFVASGGGGVKDKARITFGKNWSYYYDFNADTNVNIIIVDCKKSKFTINGIEHSITSSEWTSTESLKLFVHGYNTHLFVGYLYYVKIYNNNSLLYDFVPTVDSSSRPCLFDKVEKKCYYNQGTGEFLWG